MRRPPPRTGRWIAHLYQWVATGLTGLALFRGLDPYTVAALAALAALGGTCAVLPWKPVGLGGSIGRGLSAWFAGLAAAFALVLCLPGLAPSISWDMVLVAAFAFAGVGAVARSQLCLFIAVAGIAVFGATYLPQTAISDAVLWQAGAVFVLCAAGVYRLRSVVGGMGLLAVSGTALGALFAQLGAHPFQTLSLMALLGIVLWATGRRPWRTLGIFLLLGFAVLAQLSIVSPVDTDAILQPQSPVPYLAIAFVVVQGLVLGANLIRWVNGQASWTTVLTAQLAVAALATLAIDPTVLERMLGSFTRMQTPLYIRSALGCAVAAIALAGAWRNWKADRPVRMGAYALVAALQVGMFSPSVMDSADLAIAVAVGVGAAVLVVRFCGGFDGERRVRMA